MGVVFLLHLCFKDSDAGTLWLFQNETLDLNQGKIQTSATHVKDRHPDLLLI